MLSFQFQPLLGEHETSLPFHTLSFTIVVAAIFFIAFLKWFSQPSNLNVPPSPSKLPIIGNLHQIGLHPHRSLCALAQRHGSVMLLHFGKVPVLVVSSADAARDIMNTHDLIFANRPKSIIFEKLLYNFKDVAAASYGEYWRQMKSLCVLHLLSSKRVHSFRDVREEETALMIEKIEKLSSHSLPINLSELLRTLTNDVVCRVALGRKYSGEERRKFMELLDKFVELLGVFSVSDYVPWLGWVDQLNGLNVNLEKVAKEFDDFLEGVIEEHEKRMMNKGRDGPAQSEDQKDFVDLLLWVQKENIIGFPIDRVSIKAIILDMFAAGTDTTYTVLEWTMVELLRHPDIMRQVQNEVRGIAGDKSDVSEEDLEKMHYLKAVIKETLRFHPPIPLLVPRESTQAVKIKGYDIATGTQIFVNAWAIGRDPGLWDQPEKYWPERFLNTSIDFRGHDFQLIPFGAGRRGCPGIQFAVTINELVLANILKKFDWSLPGGATDQDLDMTESTGMTIHRKLPLIASATPISC